MIPKLSRLYVYSTLVGFALVTSVTIGSEESSKTWNSVTEKKFFHVSISPKDNPIPIGKFHYWVIEVLDHEKKAVYPARISVGGGMPGHGHGLPTQPQVTRYLDNGKYLIEGMKFNMAGDWILAFIIETAANRDRVKFDVEINY